MRPTEEEKTLCGECKHWKPVIPESDYGLCNAFNTIITTDRAEYCSRGEKNEID